MASPLGMEDVLGEDEDELLSYGFVLDDHDAGIDEDVEVGARLGGM